MLKKQGRESKGYMKTERPIWDIVKWLWGRAQGNRLQTSVNALLGVAQVAMSLLSVYAVKRAIDIASHAREGSLYTAVLLMGGIVLADFALGIAGTWVRNILGVRAQNRMQRQMSCAPNGRGRAHTIAAMCLTALKVMSRRLWCS